MLQCSTGPLAVAPFSLVSLHQNSFPLLSACGLRSARCPAAWMYVDVRSNSPPFCFITDEKENRAIDLNCLGEQWVIVYSSGRGPWWHSLKWGKVHAAPRLTDAVNLPWRLFHAVRVEHADTLSLLLLSRSASSFTSKNNISTTTYVA